MSKPVRRLHVVLAVIGTLVVVVCVHCAMHVSEHNEQERARAKTQPAAVAQSPPDARLSPEQEAERRELAREKRLVLAGVVMTKTGVDADTTGEDDTILRLVTPDCSRDSLFDFAVAWNQAMRDVGIVRVMCTKRRGVTFGNHAIDVF